MTDTSGGKFIIKYFKKKASYDDLEQCWNAVKYQNWSSTLRLVCIAEDFDIVTDTDNGQFIIKHFKKKASYDDLKECLNVVKVEGWSSILRLVCIAEDFDSDILKKYEKLVGTELLPLDLILVNEKGFQTLKISDKN